jgi:hypothetical protein
MALVYNSERSNATIIKCFLPIPNLFSFFRETEVNADR